jgi:hypothetical protein
VDIEVRNGWRFGFFPGMHGTLLVKTPDRGQSARLPTSDYLRELHGVMSRELRQIPLKAVLESGLYLAVLAFVFFIAARLRRVVQGGGMIVKPSPGAVFYGHLSLWLRYGASAS